MDKNLKKFWVANGCGDPHIIFNFSYYFSALGKMGFRFSPEFISFLTKRNDPREGKISVDNFIVLCVQLQRFTEAFRARDTQQNGTVTIGFEDFLNIALSCSL